MKQWWIKFDSRMTALSVRERLMVLGAAIAALVYLTYQLVLSPAQARRAILLTTMVQQRTEIGTIDGGVAQLEAAARIDPDRELKLRLQQLRDDSAAVRGALRSAQKGLVAPEKMSALLEHMVQGHGKLHLVSLKTLAPQGMVDGHFPPDEAAGGDGADGVDGQPAAPAKPQPQPAQIAAATVNAAAAAAASQPVAAANNANSANAAGAPAAPPAAPVVPLLYRHGVRLVLQGSYLEMIAYLESLEGLPTQLFWGGAALDAQKYPQARLTLTLYTLSLDQKWIAL